MKNNTDQSFFDEPVDPRLEARALALEVICRLLIWIADGTTVEDRGLRSTVALYCVRPDLLKGITLEEIGERSGMSRQGVYKLVTRLSRNHGAPVMNTETITKSVAERINQLHAEAAQNAAYSRDALDAALKAAWQAGMLLIEEKKRVRHTMGPRAWLLWLESNFRGVPRTAQRYMRLARSVSDPNFVQGLSLRQAYDRLGIATEPKRRGEAVVLGRLAPHVSLATKLVRTLRSPKTCALMTSGHRATYQGDLRPLYDRLRALFEN